MPEPLFFPTPAAFRAWLRANHARATELVVGFHKLATGEPSMTWSESVDEALCFGWIDGVRRAADAGRYTIRFTPRRPQSIWSLVNLAKVERLRAEGRMRPAGIAAWERRRPDRSGIYTFEREVAAFDAAACARFRLTPGAWPFFSTQPAGYRKLATAWVTSAKRPDTRERRLTQLIACSARGERLPQYARPVGTKDK